jgi:hypothetical protein
MRSPPFNRPNREAIVLSGPPEGCGLDSDLYQLIWMIHEAPDAAWKIPSEAEHVTDRDKVRVD